MTTRSRRPGLSVCGRSPVIAALVRRGLEDEQRWDDIEAALGQIDDDGHDWDDDPAAWTRHQRQGDPAGPTA